MLLEDKELKKSIPLPSAGKIFQKSESFKAITRGRGSKITLWNKTLGLHFQISDPAFSFQSHTLNLS